MINSAAIIAACAAASRNARKDDKKSGDGLPLLRVLDLEITIITRCKFKRARIVKLSDQVDSSDLEKELILPQSVCQFELCYFDECVLAFCHTYTVHSTESIPQAEHDTLEMWKNSVGHQEGVRECILRRSSQLGILPDEDTAGLLVPEITYTTEVNLCGKDDDV